MPRPNLRRMAKSPQLTRFSPDEWVVLDAKRVVEGVDRSELIRRAVAAYVPTPKTPRSLIPWDPAWGTGGRGVSASHRNLPTAEGRLLGIELARICDREEKKLRAEVGDTPPRCQGCAARAGSEANGCGETLIKFLGSLGLGEGPFYCHAGLDLEHDPDPQPKLICRAWVACADRLEIDRVQSIMREGAEATTTTRTREKVDSK